MAIVLDGTDSIGDLGDALNAKLNLAGGKVLQIVRATDATARSTSSTSFVDASLSVTITPQKNTSTILLFYSVLIQTGSNIPLHTQITNAADTAISGAENAVFRNNAGTFLGVSTIIGYDSPATLSATTYKARFKVGGGTGSLNNDSNTGQLYAIEVSA